MSDRDCHFLSSPFYHLEDILNKKLLTDNTSAVLACCQASSWMAVSPCSSLCPSPGSWSPDWQEVVLRLLSCTRHTRPCPAREYTSLKSAKLLPRWMNENLKISPTLMDKLSVSCSISKYASRHLFKKALYKLIHKNYSVRAKEDTSYGLRFRDCDVFGANKN